MSSALLHLIDADDGRPVVRFLQAGDRQVLVEFGEVEVDLRLNFHVHALLQDLRARPIEGALEVVPGFRAAMVRYEPAEVDRADLVEALATRAREATELADLVIPSRLITLPVAFDDEMTREAVNRYRVTTRLDAPNVGPGDNIDYIVRYNGFADREEFFARFLATTWWNAFIGYFPGLPSLYALDPLAQLSAPKYNPARMWTAEGAVGIGGPCVVLYPIEAPGGYQLFGRTLPIRTGDQPQPPAAGGPTVPDPLFRAGDRVRFTRVTEQELLDQRLQVLEGNYRFDVVTSDFVVAEHLADRERLAAEVEKVARFRRRAAERVEIP